ncbi:MAG: dehydrogenase [Ilumatobacteraceae bacterium]|nr:dehydrogenase [Ilumatobacteraceae bacterium]
MRALQLIGPGVIEVRDVDVPTIGPDEVLVRVAGAGLCHSDLHVLHAPINRPPLTLGHETAGWVETVGADVDGFAAGDPVLVYLVWACGHCRSCLEGRDNSCEESGRSSLPPCPGLGPAGGMAEYIAVDARFLEPLGDLDPVLAGPLADAALTSHHAIAGAMHRLGSGTTAVVIGLGGLGHTGLQILAALSEATLIGVDLDQSKLDFAAAHGATHTFLSDDTTASKILDITNGYGADAVFDFTGIQPTVDLAVGCIAPDGALRFVGLGGGTIQYGALPWSTLPWGVDLRKSYAGTRADQRAVIELAAAGKITLETRRYDLEDGLTAFDDLAAGKLLGRAILVPSR